MKPKGLVKPTTRLVALYDSDDRLPSGSTVAARRFCESNTQVEQLPSASVTDCMLPAPSYPKDVRLPSGSTRAITLFAPS